MYSLRMSFWIVPLSAPRAMPRSSATTMYMASSVAAVALMVIDVDTRSSGIASSSACMSSTLSIATPTRPTSPSARGESESMPICVGRSKATDSPVWPASSSRRKRAFVSLAVPKPAYWRMVQCRVAVHGGLHAARVREHARVAEVGVVVDAGVVRAVDGLDRQSGRGDLLRRRRDGPARSDFPADGAATAGLSPALMRRLPSTHRR